MGLLVLCLELFSEVLDLELCLLQLLLVDVELVFLHSQLISQRLLGCLKLLLEPLRQNFQTLQLLICVRLRLLLVDKWREMVVLMLLLVKQVDHFFQLQLKVVYIVVLFLQLLLAWLQILINLRKVLSANLFFFLQTTIFLLQLDIFLLVPHEMFFKFINFLDETKFLALLSRQKFIPFRNVSLQLLQLQAELLYQMLFSTILCFLCVRLIRLHALHSNFLLGNTIDVVWFCCMSLPSQRMAWLFVLFLRKQLTAISLTFAPFLIPNSLVVLYLWKVLLH